MADINQKNTELFVKSLEKVLEIIDEKKPDCIIAPMFGAVPFIDVLNIIDDDFSNKYEIEYVSASNKVHKVKDVLRGSFENIIKAYAPDGGKFISIDEVITGNSVKRVQKQFEAARINYANKKTIEIYGQQTDFRDKNIKAFRDNAYNSINYNSVGIEDADGTKVEHDSYLELVKEGTLIPVQTKKIVTMDNTDFFPAKYKLVKDSENKKTYLPVIDKFNVSSTYIDFLQNIASIIGKDPGKVTLKNMGKIRDSYKWVPEHLRHI